jgi:hypothetical protein
VFLGKKELAKIHKDIAGTIRPSWHTPPPSNFGTRSHGKLKADQWKSTIQFDLPVSVVQLWYKSDSRHQKMADSTVELSTALDWGTSNRTSKEHSGKFTSHIREYLTSTTELFPKKRLKPNHYAALRLGEFLQRFGPVHGWWMFPFERLIGVLQQINTNNKRGTVFTYQCHLPLLTRLIVGELEVTMMKSFCEASNLRSILQNSGGWSDRLKICAPIFQKWFGDDHRGTLMSDIHLIGSNISNTAEDSEPENFASQKLEILDTDIQDALLAQTKEPRYQHGKASVQKRITHRGLQYSSYDNTRRDSIIFFQPKPGCSLVPGTIRKIFSIPLRDPGNAVLTQSHFLAVHRYESIPDNIEDPFHRYPDFGASLWSENINKQVEIIDLSRKFCHGICRNWQQGILVLKPLDKVSLRLTMNEDIEGLPRHVGLLTPL